MTSSKLSARRGFGGTPKVCTSIPKWPPIPPPPPGCSCSVTLTYEPILQVIGAVVTACNPARPIGEEVTADIRIWPDLPGTIPPALHNCQGSTHREFGPAKKGTTYTVKAYLTWQDGSHCAPSATITP